MPTFKQRSLWILRGFADNLEHRDRLRWILFVVLYTVAANIPFWTASRWLDLLPLGWFCVEYAGIGLLALVLPRLVVAVLLVVVIAADLTSAVSKTYYLAPSECLTYLGSLHELPGRRLMGVACVAGLTLSVVGLALWFPVEKIGGTRRRLAALSLIGFAVLALSGDYLAMARESAPLVNPFRTLRPGDINRFSDFNSLWIGRYPVIRLRRNERLFGGGGGAAIASLNTTRPIASATALALASAGVKSGSFPAELPDVVVIVLESWGLSSDPTVRGALVSPYTDPNLVAKYRVLQGTVGFYGSTVGAESRELCGSRIGLQIANVPTKQLQACIPDRLAALGYDSVALHGMSGSMFKRQSWYNTIGFQKEWFRDSFRKEGLPDCVGAFVGTCDAAIAGWIGHRLQTREADPELLYWVTLNSHLPLPVPSGLPEGVSCSVAPALLSQSALCSWYQLVSNVHDAVAQLAVGTLGRPTIFVIVGDHAPPFVNPALSREFSETEVPYIVLLPRQENHAENHPHGLKR